MSPGSAPRLTLSMRLARLCLRLVGWRVVTSLPPTRKFVAIAAWHTSNWDFPLSMLGMWGMGLRLNFLGKQELLDGPMGWFMRRVGVLGVDRSKRGNLVKKTAQLFAERDELMLVVPAEGTRGKTEYWRTGFYYMALTANVPIAFAYVDSLKKEVGIGGYFYPTGDVEADLAQIRAFYEPKRGLKPGKQGPVAFRPRAPEPQGDLADTEGLELEEQTP